MSGAWLVTVWDTHLRVDYQEEGRTIRELAVPMDERRLYQVSKETSEAQGNTSLTGAILRYACGPSGLRGWSCRVRRGARGIRIVLHWCGCSACLLSVGYSLAACVLQRG